MTNKVTIHKGTRQTPCKESGQRSTVTLSGLLCGRKAQL